MTKGVQQLSNLPKAKRAQKTSVDGVTGRMILSSVLENSWRDQKRSLVILTRIFFGTRMLIQLDPTKHEEKVTVNSDRKLVTWTTYVTR